MECSKTLPSNPPLQEKCVLLVCPAILCCSIWMKNTKTNRKWCVYFIFFDLKSSYKSILSYKYSNEYLFFSFFLNLSSLRIRSFCGNKWTSIFFPFCVGCLREKMHVVMYYLYADSHEYMSYRAGVSIYSRVVFILFFLGVVIVLLMFAFLLETRLKTFHNRKIDVSECTSRAIPVAG